MRADLMGKKRSPKKMPATAQPSAQRHALIAIRCRAEFKEWLEAFAEQERSTPTQMVEHGLVLLAKSRGHKEPPKR